LQIIKYYHPDYEIAECTNFSLPFTDTLREGAEGDNVSIMQAYLNRISENWHIPSVGEADGLFGPCTRAAVAAFQDNFNLSAGNKGMIDKSTWYEITQIYDSIKKFDEAMMDISQIKTSADMENPSSASLARFVSLFYPEIYASEAVSRKELYEKYRAIRNCASLFDVVNAEAAPLAVESEASKEAILVNSVNPAMLMALGMMRRR